MVVTQLWRYRMECAAGKERGQRDVVVEQAGQLTSIIPVYRTKLVLVVYNFENTGFRFSIFSAAPRTSVCILLTSSKSTARSITACCFAQRAAGNTRNSSRALLANVALMNTPNARCLVRTYSSLINTTWEVQGLRCDGRRAELQQNAQRSRRSNNSNTNIAAARVAASTTATATK